METPRAPSLHPALLPPGTVVGSWLVVAWAGRGVHRAVYQAVPVDNPHASPVALNLALLPGDPRFAREVELLSCVRHPSVPRLWDQGEWQHPGGARYPFLVMDETGTWHLECLASPAPLVLNPRVSPQLNALILRVLSVPPEERGTAAELAEALEQAAERTTSESAQPLFAQEALPPSALSQENAATASMLGQPPQDSAEVRAEVRVAQRTALQGHMLRAHPPTRAPPHLQPWKQAVMREWLLPKGARFQVLEHNLSLAASDGGLGAAGARHLSAAHH